MWGLFFCHTSLAPNSNAALAWPPNSQANKNFFEYTLVTIDTQAIVCYTVVDNKKAWPPGHTSLAPGPNAALARPKKG